MYGLPPPMCSAVPLGSILGLEARMPVMQCGSGKVIGFRREVRQIAASAPAPAVVILSIISTQSGATVAVRLFQTVGPSGTAFLRLFLAAVILVAAWRPRLTGYSRSDYLAAALFGATLAAMNLTFYEGLDRIPLGVAVTLEFVGPLGVAIFGSRGLLDILWALLATVGIALIAPWGGLRIDLLGMGLAVLAGCFWGAYIVLSARVGKIFPDATGLVIAALVSAVLLLPVGIASGPSLLNPIVAGAGLAVAMLSSVVTYSLELSALRRLPTRLFGVLMSLEPAVAVLLGLVILRQAIAPRAAMAAVCVILASAGATRFARIETPAPID